MDRSVMKRILAALIALALISVCATAEVEMLAVNVGKGDAILLRMDGCTALIDAGKNKAQEKLEAAMRRFGVEKLDAVFVTHTDKDHVGGLKWLQKSGMEIGAIYASKYYPESTEKKHPAAKAAKKLDLEVVWLEAGDEIPFGGGVLRVLAPLREIPENEDDNSLVMMLESPDGRILLTGDMEEAEEKELLESGAELRCDVLKVPNHGDDDACGAGLIEACAAKTAVISTDSGEKPGTPNAQLMENLAAAGCEVYVTQDAALGVYTLLRGGEVQTALIDE